MPIVACLSESIDVISRNVKSIFATISINSQLTSYDLFFQYLCFTPNLSGTDEENFVQISKIEENHSYNEVMQNQ